MPQVRIVSPGSAPLVLDLDEFILANDFDAEEEVEIRASVERGEVYRGGGGAAPEWSVEPVL